MELPAGWEPVTGEAAEGLARVCRTEAGKGHVLHGVELRAIARSNRTDDVLFEALGKLAQVHLTWSGRAERPPWPETSWFETFETWRTAAEREEMEALGGEGDRG
jgi:hypothetical protein